MAVYDERSSAWTEVLAELWTIGRVPVLICAASAVVPLWTFALGGADLVVETVEAYCAAEGRFRGQVAGIIA